MDAAIARRAARPLDAAGAALHDRRHGQVRGARLVRVRGRDHERRRSSAGRSRRGRRADAAERRPARDAAADLVQDVARSASTGRRSTPTWALAGELGGFDGAWMNDHLTDMDPANARSVAGGVHARWRRWSTTCPGSAWATRVLSNTFRHPVLLAKAATVLDHGDGGGRFVRGPRRRLVRGRARAVRDPAAADRRADRPADLRRGGAPGAVLAGGRRGARGHPAGPVLPARPAPSTHRRRSPPAVRRSSWAARSRGASRWRRGGRPAGCCPAPSAGDVAYFADRREAILRALEAEGRDPAGVRVRRPGAHGPGRRRPGRGRSPRLARWSRPGRPRW